MSESPRVDQVGDGEENAGAKVSLTTPWQEGSEEDFSHLRSALMEGRAKASGPKYETGDTSSSEEDEESSEPPEDQTGARLLWAAQFGREEEVARLLAADPALVGFSDEDGYTALHRAAYSGRDRVCRDLLAAGADPAARTDDGWTPLHSACRWNRADCAEALLAAGAAPDAATDGGQTALHLATFSGNARETMQVLLTSGLRLDFSARNEQGETAEDLARRNGHCAAYFDLLLQDETTKTVDD